MCEINYLCGFCASGIETTEGSLKERNFHHGIASDSTFGYRISYGSYHARQFLSFRRSISETVQDMVEVTIDTNRKSHTAFDWYRFR